MDKLNSLNDEAILFGTKATHISYVSINSRISFNKLIRNYIEKIRSKVGYEPRFVQWMRVNVDENEKGWVISKEEERKTNTVFVKRLQDRIFIQDENYKVITHC